MGLGVGCSAFKYLALSFLRANFLWGVVSTLAQLRSLFSHWDFGVRLMESDPLPGDPPRATFFGSAWLRQKGPSCALAPSCGTARTRGCSVAGTGKGARVLKTCSKGNNL